MSNLYYSGSGYFKVAVKVRRGFPLWASGRVQPPEPSIGIMTEYIDDDDLLITTRRGRPTTWLWLTPEEMSSIIDQIWAALDNAEFHHASTHEAA